MQPQRYIARMNDNGDTLWTRWSTSLATGASLIYCQTDTDSSLLALYSPLIRDSASLLLTIPTYLFRMDLDGYIRWRTTVAYRPGEWWENVGLSFACDSSFVIPMRIGSWTGIAVAMLTPEFGPHDCGPLPLVPESGMDPV
jgi:hypothetical protein